MAAALPLNPQAPEPLAQVNRIRTSAPDGIVPVNLDRRHVPASLKGYEYRPYTFRPRSSDMSRRQRRDGLVSCHGQSRASQFYNMRSAPWRQGNSDQSARAQENKTLRRSARSGHLQERCSLWNEGLSRRCQPSEQSEPAVEHRVLRSRARSVPVQDRRSLRKEVVPRRYQLRDQSLPAEEHRSLRSRARSVPSQERRSHRKEVFSMRYPSRAKRTNSKRHLKEKAIQKCTSSSGHSVPTDDQREPTSSTRTTSFQGTLRRSLRQKAFLRPPDSCDSVETMELSICPVKMPNVLVTPSSHVDLGMQEDLVWLPPHKKNCSSSTKPHKVRRSPSQKVEGASSHQVLQADSPYSPVMLFIDENVSPSPPLEGFASRPRKYCNIDWSRSRKIMAPSRHQLPQVATPSTLVELGIQEDHAWSPWHKENHSSPTKRDETWRSPSQEEEGSFHHEALPAMNPSSPVTVWKHENGVQSPSSLINDSSPKKGSKVRRSPSLEAEGSRQYEVLPAVWKHANGFRSPSSMEDASTPTKHPKDRRVSFPVAEGTSSHQALRTDTPSSPEMLFIDENAPHSPYLVESPSRPRKYCNAQRYPSPEVKAKDHHELLRTNTSVRSPDSCLPSVEAPMSEEASSSREHPPLVRFRGHVLKDAGVHLPRCSLSPTDVQDARRLVWEVLMLENDQLFLPSVFGCGALHTRDMYSSIEKATAITALEIILNRVAGEQKHMYVYELSPRFYYPGKYLLLMHLAELENFIIMLENHHAVPGLLHAFHEALLSVENAETLSPESLNCVYSLSCTDCQHLELTAGLGMSVRTSLQLLQQRLRHQQSCKEGGLLHRYEEAGLGLLAGCPDPEVALTRLDLERRKLERRGVLPRQETGSSISHQWDMVFHMAFSKDHFLGYYYWEAQAVRTPPRHPQY